MECRVSDALGGLLIEVGLEEVEGKRDSRHVHSSLCQWFVLQRAIVLNRGWGKDIVPA